MTHRRSVLGAEGGFAVAPGAGASGATMTIPPSGGHDPAHRVGQATSGRPTFGIDAIARLSWPFRPGRRQASGLSAAWFESVSLQATRDAGEDSMAIQRMDNVGIVVEDMDAAIAFFVELGMELEGRAEVAGLFADQCTGLDGVHCDIAMVRTPDGHSRLELAKYRSPAVISAEPRNRPHNVLGTHRVMFAVDDIEDTVARLRPHGAELLGEIARFENSHLLCYVRGPEGIIIGLAEQLR